MLGADASAFASARPSQAVSVSLPNGFATLAADDLVLRTTAGPVRWSRVWDGQEWKFNPHWESLSSSWRNLTGSAAADTSSQPTHGDGGSPRDGCWVWVDEDWQPSSGTTLIGGPTPTPGREPVPADRMTPFNRVMGEDDRDYPPLQRVNVDYAALCVGLAFGSSPVRDAEGIRRLNELYLGESGQYAFSNRATIEKRAVQELPPLAAGATLGAAATLTPRTNAKGFRWLDRAGDWIDYNTQGQVVAWGDRHGNKVWMQRDARGTLQGVLDGHGRVLYTLHYQGTLLVEVRDVPIAGLAEDLPARSVRYGYDDKNHLVQVTDARGQVTRYGYDAAHRLVTITDAEGRVERLEYSGDTVTRHTAADGAVTDYAFEYDDANRRFHSKITRPETAAGRRVEDYVHNRVGKLVQRRINGRSEEEIRYDAGTRGELSTNARGFTTRVTRNEFEQVVQIDRPDGSRLKRSYSALHLGLTEEIDAAGVKTQYQYDAESRLVRQIEAAGTAEERITDYEVDAAGRVVKATRRGRTEADATVTPDAVWQFEYDAQGQTRRTIDAEGHVRHYVHDRAGNLVRTVDPLGHVVRFSFDPLGALLQATDATGSVRRYAYDKVGNLVQVTDPRGKMARHAYDAANRRTQSTDAAGGTRRLAFDAQGQPVSETDGDGRVRRFESDAYSRLSREVDGAGHATAYRYDIADGSSAGTLGALYSPTEIRYPTFTVQQRYDAMERPTTTVVQRSATDSAQSRSEYDPRGLLTAEVDAYGKTVRHVHDLLGRPQEVVDRLGGTTAVRYDARGNLVRVIDALGNTHTFAYDRNDRLVKETLPLGQSTAYAYDAAGRLAERIDPLGQKTTYAWDAAGRLSGTQQYRGSVLVRTHRLYRTPRSSIGPGARLQAEAHPESVDGIHGGDGQREVDQVLLGQGRGGRGVGLVRGVRFAHAGHLFRPGEGGAFLCGEQIRGLVPDGHQDDGLDGHAGLDEIAGGEVDAMGAAIDLGYPQEDQVDQPGGKRRAGRDVAKQPA